MPLAWGKVPNEEHTAAVHSTEKEEANSCSRRSFLGLISVYIECGPHPEGSRKGCERRLLGKMTLKNDGYMARALPAPVPSLSGVPLCTEIFQFNLAASFFIKLCL